MRRFWVLALLVVLLLGSTAAGIALYPGFYPRNVEVSGNRIVSREEVIARARVLSNVNMWLQNPQTIARRVEAIAYVAQAYVHRVPPATIAIAIVERTPYAVLRSGRDYVLVDKELRVLQPASGPQPPLVELDAGPGTDPTVGATLSAPGIVALRDDYQAMLAAHVTAASLGRDRYGELVATLPGNVTVRLGDEEDLARKLALVEPILTQVAHAGRPVASIDLRAVGTPVVVYRQ